MRFVPSLGRHGLRRGNDRDTAGTRGQSLVELALVAPVLLLIVLTAIDFGRVYLGYINLQQMARLAGSYAADNASAWDTTPDAARQARYQEIIENDARAINCELPRDGSGNLSVPGPAFPGGFDLGDPAEIRISCQFAVITPIIAQVLGGQVQASASMTYPVREGVVAGVPGGGGGGSIPPPIADFIASPVSGYAPLEVTFVDTSLNGPTSWQWTFGNGTNASTQGPHTRTYDCTGAVGTVCTFFARLEVGNAGGFATTDAREITVTVRPDTGPVAEFTASPTVGVEPLNVDFEFVEVTTGVTYTDWSWDFGDGTAGGTGQTPSHTYAAPGSYDVTLTVTDDTGASNSQTKTSYIGVTEEICTVPDFAEVRRNQAQARWTAAGFTTTVNILDGQGNYTINTQSIVGGTIDPQPDGCDSNITVGP